MDRTHQGRVPANSSSGCGDAVYGQAGYPLEVGEKRMSNSFAGLVDDSRATRADRRLEGSAGDQ
jgi:hypothetical protein